MLEFDPVARRLPVHNLGSSGQDGVSIELPNALGSAMGPGVEFAKGGVIQVDGLSSTWERQLTMYSGASVAGVLTVHSNSDGSETVTADYSASGASRVTVFVIDDQGQRVAAQTVSASTIVLTIVGDAFAGSAASEDGYAVHAFDETHRKMQVHYPAPVYISGGGLSSVKGTTCQIHCSDGFSREMLTSVTLTGAVAPGSPAGEFTLEQVGIVPPCAGCPNGPEELGMCTTLGDATFELGTTSTGGRRRQISNLGSSGQDGVALKLSGPRSDCCSAGAGYNNLFVYNRPSRTLDAVVSGNVGGIEQALASMHVDVHPDHADFVPDFLAVGTPYTIRLRRNGAIVAEAVSPPTPVSHWDPTAALRLQTDTQTSTGAAGFRIICITSPCPGWPVMLNGAMYAADEIAFEPTGAGLTAMAVPSNLTEFALRATGEELPFDGITLNTSATNVSVGPEARSDLAAVRLFPNPAQGPVQLVLAMATPSLARVSVVDVAGRNVRILADRTFGAGAHELRWDGLDDAGRVAAAGVYFVRVQSAGGERMTRLTRLW